MYAKGVAWGVFTFIESTPFARVRDLYLDDDEYSELQQFLMQNPESGKVVRGSGGVRKLRWRREGGGKRGGLRVIYFVRYQPRAVPYSEATEGGVR